MTEKYVIQMGGAFHTIWKCMLCTSVLYADYPDELKPQGYILLQKYDVHITGAFSHFSRGITNRGRWSLP